MYVLASHRSPKIKKIRGAIYHCTLNFWLILKCKVSNRFCRHCSTNAVHTPSELYRTVLFMYKNLNAEILVVHYSHGSIYVLGATQRRVAVVAENSVRVASAHLFCKIASSMSEESTHSGYRYLICIYQIKSTELSTLHHTDSFI